MFTFFKKYQYLPYKVRSAVWITATGGVMFLGINLLQGSEKFYRESVMPIVHRVLDPEEAHGFAIKMAKYGLVPPLIKRARSEEDNARLSVQAFGHTFENPIGCAAGFDKHGEAMSGLFKMGFGFVEVGSVTPEPQEGNPKPRVFRLSEDKGIINRYGFNSEGYTRVHARVSEFTKSAKTSKQILGINIGKNKTSTDAASDYLRGLQLFAADADYLVVNISSPNTPGLRELQKKNELESLIDKLLDERNKIRKNLPIIVKIAPDLNDAELNDIARILTRKNKSVDGIIISNTTISRPASLISAFKNETGGLSGQPLKQLSNETIRKMYSLTNGQLPIIGVGGVENGADALEKIKCGASLVQLYTALVYAGPPLIEKIKDELSALLKKEGFANVQQATGFNVKSKLG